MHYNILNQIENTRNNSVEKGPILTRRRSIDFPHLTGDSI